MRAAILYPENSDPDHVAMAKLMALQRIQLQWVVGDATKAESSYFRINQQVVTINPTELLIIKNRRKPTALATRSLIRAGTGHKYWSAFATLAQEQIEEIAREIYDTLFQPPLEEPLRSIDIPLAGRGYSSESVKMVFDLVNTINGISSESLASIPDDKDGSATLKYLREVRKVAERIGSLKPSSLGLHPFVYFYGANGRFSSTAFLATAAFVKELERRNAFAKFTTIRSQFEEFLIEHRTYAFEH